MSRRMLTELLAPVSFCPQEETEFSETLNQAIAFCPSFKSIANSVGDTPLLSVPGLPGIHIKVEAMNPTGTVKARTAVALLADALAHGRRRLVEYSGGSLAIALSRFCADIDLDLKIVVPEAAPKELAKRLRDQGTEVEVGVRGLGFLGSILGAANAAESEARSFLFQHRSIAALRYHRDVTGKEVVKQLIAAGIEPDAVVASVGTGSSIMGLSLALRSVWPRCRTVAVFPDTAPYGDKCDPTNIPRMNGTGGLGYGICQPLMVPLEGLFETAEVSYPTALAKMRELKEDFGIAISSSAGGALAAAVELQKTSQLENVVTIAACRGTTPEWSAAYK